MNNEFKKITNKNETRYILESMTAGATGASSIASAPVSLGKLRKRLEELKDKISVPTTKPRNPTGMGSTPGRGTQVHKDKKRDQKMGKEKHKKPFAEQMMDEIETIAELEKPSGSMFLKFRGKRLPGDEMMLLGYGGFGTTPKDVTVGNALVKPFPADKPYDVINKIESLFKDKDFVGVEKIVLDIPNALAGQLRDVLDYAEQDPERFELYAGDDEEPEAKTGGKVIGIGPDGKRINREPAKAQVGGSSRGVKQSKPDVTLSPKTPQAQTLLKQSGLPRTGSGYKAPHALLQKLQSSLGQSKFDSMFNVGGMAEGDQPDHEISMASSELQSIAADAANLLDIVKQRSEEEGLEAWQQSKITKAADFMNSVLQSIRGDEEQGVAEGGILKSIKRGLQGWDKNAVGPGGEKLGDPRDIVKRAKAMDTDTAKKVRSGLDAASDHSPAGLQKRVLDRKLKGVAEGSGPQEGDEVYYGNRLVGWFKGYSKLGKIITEPNVDEMGDEYLNKDAYWDPQDKITIKPKQGVAEGSNELDSGQKRALIDAFKYNWKGGSVEKAIGHVIRSLYVAQYLKSDQFGAAEDFLYHVADMEQGHDEPRPDHEEDRMGLGLSHDSSKSMKEGPEENKKWRDQARKASGPWSPTNLPNYKKNKEQGVAEDDPLAARQRYAQQHKNPGQVYKPTHPGDKKGMTKAYAYDIKRTGPKGQLPKEDVGEGLRDPKDNPCWKGYKPVGTKKKGGKTVPNCVPTNEDAYINQLMSALESKK